MVENLKRVREPVAWALLAVLIGFMALNVVRLALVLGEGALPVFTAFAAIATNIMSLTLVALLVTLVCLCLFIGPATPNSIRLARVSALVVTVGTVLTIVATGIGLWSSTGVWSVLFEVLGGLLDIVLKVLATAVLWVIARAVGTGRMATPTPPVVPAPDFPRALTDEAPPIWQPSAASGSVWKTAADAAAGSGPAIGPVGAPVTPALGPTAPAASDVRYTAASAWAENPTTRPGAAEALGWRRADAASEPDRSAAERDTP